MATQPTRTRTEPAFDMPRFRVSQVTLEGFKAFKEPFTLDIPPPLVKDDFDVFVIGSENGVGKTSVLDGICLALVSTEAPAAPRCKPEAMPVNVGAETAHLTVKLGIGSDAATIELSFGPRIGHITRVSPSTTALHSGPSQARAHMVDKATSICTGHEPDPLVTPPLLYLHSYRQVAPGGVDLVGPTGPTGPTGPGPQATGSTFKHRVVRALLAKGQVLEGDDRDEAVDEQLARLNDLVCAFSGGRIERLKPLGTTYDVRVIPGDSGPPMSFDALSSGQKEIISTLFLIWEATRACPSVVLIDEPELHLHGSWHDDVIRELRKLAPWNQYIIATHSQRIAESVDRDRLRILRP